MHMIFMFLISFPSMAGIVKVEGHRNYELKYDEAGIYLTTPVKKVFLPKKKCNRIMFSDFEKKVSKFKNLSLKSGHKEEGLNFSLDDKDFNAVSESAEANFVDSLPEEIERMQIEEKLRCN